MPQPEYRKHRGFAGYVWHCCLTCPEWPRTGYDSQATPGDPLCDHCQRLVKAGACS